LSRVPHDPVSGRHSHHEGGVWDASRLSNLAIHRLTRCADVPFSIWYGACRHIMVQLPSMIDCLCFFFVFSLLTTKVHNCPLFVCYLFRSSNPSTLDLKNMQDPRFVGLTTIFGERPKRGLTTMFGARPGSKSDMVARLKLWGAGNLVQVYCELRQSPL